MTAPVPARLGDDELVCTCEMTREAKGWESYNGPEPAEWEQGMFCRAHPMESWQLEPTITGLEATVTALRDQVSRLRAAETRVRELAESWAADADGNFLFAPLQAGLAGQILEALGDQP